MVKRIKYDAVVVASGKGERLNLGYNKVFYKLENAKTILENACLAFIEDEDCQKIIIVTNEKDYPLVFSNPKVILTSGGNLRQDSVYNGLVLANSEYVFIHDGARPYLKKEALDRLKAALVYNDAAILGIPCKDTVKYVEDGLIKKTIKRENVYLAQTPQAFKRTILLNDYKIALKENIIFTDEAMVFELFKRDIKMVLGDITNNKITFKEDLK